MQALVEIAGHQFDVKAKDVVKVPHLQGNIGDVIEFPKLFLAINGDETIVGTPTIQGKVTAQIIEHGKDKKVLVFKKKRRKGYKKLNGHRQQFTKIAITGVSIENFGSEEVELSEIPIKIKDEEAVDTREENVIFDDTAIEDITEDDDILDNASEETSEEATTDDFSEEIEDSSEKDKFVFDDTEDLDDESDDQENKENK